MPTYLTALTGDRNMHTLWGTSAIYASSLDHFAIYLRPKPGECVGTVLKVKAHTHTRSHSHSLTLTLTHIHTRTHPHTRTYNLDEAR